MCTSNVRKVCWKFQSRQPDHLGAVILNHVRSIVCKCQQPYAGNRELGTPTLTHLPGDKVFAVASRISFTAPTLWSSYYSNIEFGTTGWFTNFCFLSVILWLSVLQRTIFAWLTSFFAAWPEWSKADVIPVYSLFIENICGCHLFFDGV